MKKITFGLVALALIPTLASSQNREQILVYFENFDGASNDWSGDWETTYEDYSSPPSSLTDSPGGDYGNNENNSVELTIDIDLTEYSGARLEFQTKFEIEQGFDYVQMYVTNDGMNWVDFFTFSGEDPGEHYTWHLFETDLGEYVGFNIRFKFTLISNGTNTADGMYIDDFAVYGMSMEQVPTLSEWGMIIMALLLLALGTVAVVRRKKAAPSKAA